MTIFKRLSSKRLINQRYCCPFISSSKPSVVKIASPIDSVALTSHHLPGIAKQPHRPNGCHHRPIVLLPKWHRPNVLLAKYAVTKTSCHGDDITRTSRHPNNLLSKRHRTTVSTPILMSSKCLIVQTSYRSNVSSPKLYHPNILSPKCRVAQMASTKHLVA